MNNAKPLLIVLSAPSGCGKSTLIDMLLDQYRDMIYSISCTTRSPRGDEEDGLDYYFMTHERFEKLLSENAFIEHACVHGNYYGTLKSEIDRIQSAGRTIVFDIDVKGGLNLKRIFGDEAMAIFVAPPSVEELPRRLHGRGDTSEEMIQKRLAKAEIEIADAPYFDHIVVNDDLAKAKAELDKLVNVR